MNNELIKDVLKSSKTIVMIGVSSIKKEESSSSGIRRIKAVIGG